MQDEVQLGKHAEKLRLGERNEMQSVRIPL